MSIRKRRWKGPKGEDREAWVLDYADAGGTRRLKTFARKKDADAFAAKVAAEIRDGTHVADSASITVREAGELWIKKAARRVERATLVQYRQHLAIHISPFIGTVLLSRLTVPALRKFEDQLSDAGRSSTMIRKVMISLGSILADAQDRGEVVRNVVREKGRRAVSSRAERRQKGKLKVGVDIPTREEIKAIVDALDGRWRPVLLTATFTGMRASELRGLRWADIDLDAKRISVRQRADRFNDIGNPKSEAGERTIPIPPIVVNMLREWRLTCPRPRIGRDANGKPLTEEIKPEQFVFPNGLGKVETLGNIVKRGFAPTQIKAGVTIKAGTDKNGQPILAAKYGGLHCLRHWFASWCINRREDGGLGLTPKIVQERLGHSTIELTMNTYSHLFPRLDDASELATAEAALLK